MKKTFVLLLLMDSIDSTGTFTNNPEYYLMKHLSHFVKPGSHRLDVGDVNALAFVNPDEEIVIENELNEKVVKAIKINDRSISITLKQTSFNTLSLKL